MPDKTTPDGQEAMTATLRALLGSRIPLAEAPALCARLAAAMAACQGMTDRQLAAVFDDAARAFNDAAPAAAGFGETDPAALNRDTANKAEAAAMLVQFLRNAKGQNLPENRRAMGAAMLVRAFKLLAGEVGHAAAFELFEITLEGFRKEGGP